MKTKFCIVSDGSCDLPEDITRKKDISIVHFYVSFDGVDYKKEGIDIPLAEFYQQMVEHPKSYPKSAAPSPDDFYQVFESRVKAEQKDIICICISSKLSASAQSAEIAKNMIQENYPDVKVTVLDSLSTTLMQGAYVLEVCRMRDAGYTSDEAAAAMQCLIKTGRILFTVGDLDYLQHGGRIGKVTSIAGTLLNVKPLITLQDGEIHSSGIRRGRRKSLTGVIDLLISYLKDNNCTPDDCQILIGYCYDYDEACRFKEMTIAELKKIYGIVTDIPICRIGATIGVHAGPYSIGYGIIRRYDRPFSS